MSTVYNVWYPPPIVLKRHKVKTSTHEISQRGWGRIAGVSLLLIILSGVLGNHLVVQGDAVGTAGNIIHHERQFRIGLIGELLMLNSDVVLAVAFFAVFKPVDSNLALLGTFWRLANAMVQSVGVVASLVALDCLGGAHYLAAESPADLQIMATQFLDIHGTGMFVGLLLWSFGAATHSYLFFKSGYIPKILSMAYLMVASIICVCCISIIIFPDLDATIDPWFILPDFFVELVVALWLIFKSVDISLSQN